MVGCINFFSVALLVFCKACLHIPPRGIYIYIVFFLQLVIERWGDKSVVSVGIGFGVLAGSPAQLHVLPYLSEQMLA